MSDSFGSEAIAAAIEAAPGTAICAYVTAGYPSLDSFPDILRSVAESADLVEIGVPFTDPMADGLTIQRASHMALENGVTLKWILDLLTDLAPDLSSPRLLMGYYNPFLAFGLDRLGFAMKNTATSGLIVPDLPLEENRPMRAVLEPLGLALVHMATPTTPQDRLARLASPGGGFLYAVTTTGVTGGNTPVAPETLSYLDRVRSAVSLPVLAGFGVRSRDQVEALSDHVDGVVVGSALIEAIDRGEDPGAFLEQLRPTKMPA